jgi:hypothetical protein
MNNNYPKTLKCFYDFLKTNTKYENLYVKLGCPSTFDVTLRDGIQSLSLEKQKEMNLDEKKNIYHSIYYNHKPKNFEVGSLVSNKILPVFDDTFDLLNYIITHQKMLNNNFSYLMNLDTDNYILVPNSKKLKETFNNKDKLASLYNYSFITSVSNSFQCKNTRMTLNESDEDILNMVYMLDNIHNKNSYQIKLYVSCINECPIEGKINSDTIVSRILKIHNFRVDNICLSDTCGTIEIEDLKYILSKCIEKGIPRSKLSLHLHVRKGREIITEELIHVALKLGIVNFDVSLLETGGCSVTINKNKLAPNLSYDLFYKSLVNYLIKYA